MLLPYLYPGMDEETLRARIRIRNLVLWCLLSDNIKEDLKRRAL